MGRRFSSISVLLRILIVSTLFLFAFASATCKRVRGAAFEPARAENHGSAVDLHGAAVDPLKASGRKVVVLIFVRVDCPISNRYSPTIQRIAHENAARVAYWLVYPDRSESAEQIRKHEREFGYDLPALRDVQRSLVAESHAQTTPEAAVFDANRKLVYHGRIDNSFEDFGRARPAATTHELEDAIRAALDGKEVANASVPAVGCYISDLK
ncbi:MAG: redoxin domain-containing protein [Acidobacteria bacterium]|nr:redoxin domain-containing protein [Acidobacteriota bacterium]